MKGVHGEMTSRNEIKLRSSGGPTCVFCGVFFVVVCLFVCVVLLLSSQYIPAGYCLRCLGLCLLECRLLALALKMKF